jgi:hypothetical protein
MTLQTFNTAKAHSPSAATIIALLDIDSFMQYTKHNEQIVK